MKRYFFRYILLLVLMTSAGKTFCQTDSLDILGASANAQKKAKTDTLLTYVFGDWHKNAISFSWTHNPYFNTIERIPIKDTFPDDIRIEYPFFKADVGAVFLGAAGSAAIALDFFQRKNNEYFKFFEPYDIYAFAPDNTPFYNTKRPFTVLSYQTSGSKINEESNIRVLHTQNIRPELNIGLLYQRYGTKGQYTNEATDNKAFSLFASYTGKRYVAHAAYSFTNVSNRENGGIQNDSDITDTIITSKDIYVNLENARNTLRKQTFFFTHSLGIPIDFFKKNKDENVETQVGEGTLIYLGNSLEYTSFRRKYTDVGGEDENYYSNWYYNAKRTSDSSHTSFFDAKVFARIQPWASDAIISTIAGGLGYRNQKYYVFNPDQYLTNINTSSENDLYFYANAAGKFSKYFEWNGYTRYFITGKTNFTLDGNIRVSVYPITNGIHLKGRFLFQYYEPNFFEKNYYSNHLIWENDFETTTRTQIEGTLSIPDFDLEIGAKQALIQNYIYSDTAAIPRQYGGNLSVTSFFVRKNFKLGLFHLNNEILMQISGNENVLPLPKISAHASWYLQASLVKSVLMTQIGLDVRYNTRYYAYAYNPALGDFHVQQEKKIGNFPYVEAFINLKWKRTDIFVKMANILKDSCGSEYFSALHYPRNNAMLLRLGLTWHFFN
ncbi:MAG: putative porin [Prevotellaceae bacterium]|nr:putative porin [Prevotellaceae bacterium]